MYGRLRSIKCEFYFDGYLFGLFCLTTSHMNVISIWHSSHAYDLSSKWSLNTTHTFLYMLKYLCKKQA